MPGSPLERITLGFQVLQLAKRRLYIVSGIHLMHKARAGWQSEILQIYIGAQYGLEECTWSPQVAKGSGSAAEVGYSHPGPNF